MPWAGGINSAQVNMMDLNGDSKNDLVIFDRAAAKILTFINNNNQFAFAPDYASLFPAEVNSWLLLRDINGDGKKDLFTSDPFGMVAFINITKPGGALTWRAFNPGFPILTKGFSGNINLKVNEDDIPVIDDVDGDGDLDILAVRFVGIGTVEWHKNFSKENNRSDTLIFERITQTWGEFTECSCGTFDYGSGCKTLGGRTEHTGGKSMAIYDLNNDGDRDLIFSEESCLRFYLLENKGSKDNALMTGSSIYPAAAPAAMPFPAAYFEDVDFDGKTDLIASSNLEARDFVNNNFQKTVWFYKNTGTNTLPVLSLVKQNFLQDEMIEVGDYAVPAFTDADGDADQDMFISTYAGSNFTSSIYFFENIGSIGQPEFRLATSDYLGFSFSAFYNLKIQFVDANADGKTDLAFTATNRNGVTALYYLPNQSADALLFSDSPPVAINFQIGRTENAHLVDVNQDGLMDILLGKSSGSLQYWKNIGTGSSPAFTQASAAFLGISGNFDFQNMSLSTSDLDADGRDDLVIGNPKGVITIFGDFRSQNTSIAGVDEIIYNTISKKYAAPNLGASLWTVAVNLFNSDKPAIVAGTTLGGVLVLKNDEGNDLPEEPALEIYPNPVAKGETMIIRPDRNVLVQFYTLLGQKISETYFVPAHQQYPVPISTLSAGMYIARVSFRGKVYGKKFIVR